MHRATHMRASRTVQPIPNSIEQMHGNPVEMLAESRATCHGDPVSRALPWNILVVLQHRDPLTPDSIRVEAQRDTRSGRSIMYKERL